VKPDINIYFIPFPEWIVQREFGELWQSIPKCPTYLNIREWFRTSVLFAGRRLYLELNGVKRVDWSLSANDFGASLGCPMNHWLLYSTIPLLSTEINFTQGLYGRVSNNNAHKITKVLYNKNAMIGYEINAVKINCVYIDFKGEYELLK